MQEREQEYLDSWIIELGRPWYQRKHSTDRRLQLIQFTGIVPLDVSVHESTTVDRSLG